jgi:glycogen debranching enzyme
MNRELVDEARWRAEAGLLANGSTADGPSALGLLGANQAYQQVWARDSMICALGLLVCERDEGAAVHRRSLQTLRAHQSPLGKIPHNVGLPDGDHRAPVGLNGSLHNENGSTAAVADTAHAGCVDSNLWYIVGHYAAYVHGMEKDPGAGSDLLRESWPSLQQALLWLRYQDSNECGLLEVHEAMDWADLFANRYNVLFDNVLYYAAWKSMATMAQALGEESAFYHEQAQDVHRKLNALLWVGPESPKDWRWIDGVRKEWLYPLRRVETELVERPFYLPYMAFRDYADRFDTLANLLAILVGVADAVKTDKILDYIEGCGLNQPYPVQALYPVIHPGERDWREYYRLRNLNQPHHYHNGGAWPFIGGFYVAALVKAGRQAEAERQLEKLALMNREGRKRAGDEPPWEFNEWFHGLSGRPMGHARQSWSLALYIFAHEAVRQGRVPIFGDAVEAGPRGEVAR